MRKFALTLTLGLAALFLSVARAHAGTVQYTNNSASWQRVTVSEVKEVNEYYMEEWELWMYYVEDGYYYFVDSGIYRWVENRTTGRDIIHEIPPGHTISFEDWVWDSEGSGGSVHRDEFAGDMWMSIDKTRESKTSETTRGISSIVDI